MLVHVVHEIESERGWGQRLEDIYYFESEDLAVKFCNTYNEKYNNGNTVPDWYMRQEYVGTKIELNEDVFNKRKYNGELIDVPKWEFK